MVFQSSWSPVPFTWMKGKKTGERMYPLILLIYPLILRISGSCNGERVSIFCVFFLPRGSTVLRETTLIVTRALAPRWEKERCQYCLGFQGKTYYPKQHETKLSMNVVEDTASVEISILYPNTFSTLLQDPFPHFTGSFVLCCKLHMHRFVISEQHQKGKKKGNYNPFSACLSCVVPLKPFH